MRIAQLSIPLVGVALFGVTTAMTAWAGKADEGEQATVDFGSAMQSVEGKVTRATAALNENVRAQAVNALQSRGAFEQAKALGLSYQDVTDAALGNQGAIGRVNAALRAALALNPAVSKGNSEQRNSAESLSKSLGLVAHASIDAAEQERVRRIAMGQASDTTVRAKSSAEQMADAQRGLKKATKDLNSELQKSIDKMTILKEGALSIERANINWEESLDNLKGTVKANADQLGIHEAKTDRDRAAIRRRSKSLDESTDVGRKNRRAIIDAMSSLDEKTKADYKNAASSKNASREVGKASERYKDNREQLRRAAVAAGYNRDEVDKLIRKYLKTPKKVETDIRNDAKDEQKKVDHYTGAIKDIPKSKNTNINAKFGSSGGVSLTASGKAHQTWKAVTKAADGAVLPGWTPGRDVHRFMSLSPGVPDLALSGGEGIARPEFVRFMGGAAGWARWNRDAKAGKLAGVEAGTLAFAGGGLFAPSDNAVPKVANPAGRWVGRQAGEWVAREALAYLREQRKAWEAAQAAAAASGGGDPGGPAVGGSRRRVSWKGGTFTERFRNTLIRAQRFAGRSIPVYQGGFSRRVRASGTSHYGDAIDTVWSPAILRGLRRARVAAWHRTPAQGFIHHIHGVPLPGAGYPGGSGVWQARDYLRGGNGLAGGGVASRVGLYRLADGGQPERVLSGRQTRSFERLVGQLDRSGGAPVIHITVEAPHFVGDQADLVRALTKAEQLGQLDTLKRRFTR